MAKASDLPTEIWLLIIRYLLKSQVLQLKSLNTFFFCYAMDINWRQVVIDTRYAHQVTRVLSRMADPFVASRTRRLSVCLRQPRFKEETPTPSTSWKLSLSKLSILSKTKPQRPASTSVQAALVTHLLKTLPLLHKLTFFEIELLHISPDLLSALFRTITTSPLAKTIKILSLGGHPDMFASLVEHPTFENLSALNINLTNREPVDDDNDNYPMVTASTPNNILSLARFILSLSPSLQLLRIWNSSVLDISLLFSRLSQPLHDSSSLIPLPNLKSIFLILPFDISFPSSPQSIHRFLLVHSTNIQHLQLRLMMSRRTHITISEEPLRSWLSDFVAHDSNNDSTTKPSHFFPNLQTLDIYPPSKTPAGLSAMLIFIKRTAPTLSSLIICGRELSSEAANQVVYALTEGDLESSTLKSLRMDISHLDVPFVELLAYRLPQLQQLRLNVTNCPSQCLFL